MTKISGIYIWTSLSGGQYVGSAVNLQVRKKSHINDLSRGKHKNPMLQRAWNKYGEDGLKFTILLVCHSSLLLFYEQRAMDILKPRYNICLVAGSMLGVKQSDETKDKHRKAALGIKRSTETRKRISDSKKGWQPSDEWLEANRKRSIERGMPKEAVEAAKFTQFKSGTRKSAEEIELR